LIQSEVLMRKFVQVVLLLALVASTLAQPFAPVTVAAPPTQRPTNVDVSLASDPIEIIESTRNGETFTSFGASVPLQGEAGAPALPVVSEIVGIPANVAPTLSYALADATPLGTAPHAIEPMPSYTLVSETGEYGSESLTGSYARNDSFYRAGGWYPAEPVWLSDPFTLRGQAMIRVEYSPIQVNLATGEIRFISGANVVLTWEESALTGTTEVRNDPLWEDVFASTLSNYDEARAWRSARTPAVAERAAEGGSNRWLIRVEGEGLFKTPLSQLQSAGVNISDPTKLALYHGWGEGAEEQAIWIDGGILYFINTRDHGYWSNQVTYNLTVLGTNGLRMVAEPSAPTQSGSPLLQVTHTDRFEEEHRYNAGATATEGNEHWFWDILIFFPALPVYTTTTTFDLPALVPNTNASVFTELGPDFRRQVACYRAKVTVNDATTGEYQWSNYQPFGQTLNMTPGQLTPTGNDFTVNGIHCPGNTGGGAGKLAFNAFNVTYQRYLTALNNELRFDGVQAARNYQLSGFTANDIASFEISQLNTPTLMTGGTVSGSGTFNYAFGRADTGAEEFLVTPKSAGQAIAGIEQYVDRGIRTDLTQTDWILITHPDFISAVQPLAAHRQSQGLTTRIVNVDDIYNDFGVGVADPDAIREFLKFAYQSWNAPAPSYVFIVGDGTYDPLNYSGVGAPTWVPPIFRDVDIYLGDVPADNAYVNGLDVGDAPTDSTPDMHVGRLTPNSASEVAALVQKIITYDNDDSAFNDWRRTMLLTTDNPDSAGNFHQLSERIFGNGGGPNLIPEEVKVIRAYLYWDPDGGGPLPVPYPPDPSNPPPGYISTATRIAHVIANTINRGALIVQYIGHGSPDQWAGDGIWTLRTTGSRDDLALLNPTDRFSFGLPWTCWEGYFVHTDDDDWSMSEVMTRQGDRGFIGSFAPTGLDVAEGHDVMTQAFYDALFGLNLPNPAGDSTQNFGELVLRSKLPNIGGGLDRLTYAYMLYGDPASNLPVPPCLLGQGECASDGVRFLPLNFHQSN
jgi:hypothetical protein